MALIATVASERVSVCSALHPQFKTKRARKFQGLARGTTILLLRFRIARFCEGPAPVAMVLIVEDDEQVRVLAESILEQAGHETRSAATMTEASAIIESDEKIDALFVDMALLDHQEAGLELAQAAADARPGLPVVYATGRGVTDGMRALFVERNVFLAKPYRPEELLTAIENVLK